MFEEIQMSEWFAIKCLSREGNDEGLVTICLIENGSIVLAFHNVGFE